MIRLKSLDFKIKNRLLSVQSLFRECLAKHPLHREMCPFCGAVGQCRPHGSYHRNLVHFMDGKVQVFRLRIKRVLCSCRHSHALLPDLAVPYLSYSLPMILQILSDYFSRRLTLSALCEKYSISLPVLYRFKKLFLRHKREWLGVLEDLETKAPLFLEQLRERESYSAAAFEFLKQTTYSFLQSHKNPANCARPHFPDSASSRQVHNL